MNVRNHKFSVGILGGLLAASVLGGCGYREQDKTIVLPTTEYQMADSGKFRIDHIQEYAGRGDSGEVLCMALGEPGTDTLYLLKKEQESYLYQTIDISEDTVRSSILMEERAMANIRIAPGGRYLSYEVQEGDETSLVVFFPAQGTRLVLHIWEDPEEIFSYVWSDDGTKLFSWQSGDTGNPHEEWQVTRYGMETGPDGSFQSTAVQFQMRGNGRAWRSVLPNADGSEVYVRDQVSVFSDSLWEEREMGEEGDQARSGSGTNIEAAWGEGQDTGNWLLFPDTARAMELPEYSEESVYPVRYTPAGLFIQEENGTLYLIRDIRSQPVKKELASGNPGSFDPVPYVCANGDHVFLMEWINYSMYQIRGLRILDGEADGQPVVLYRDNYESMVQLTVVEDQAVVFWGDEYSGNGAYRYKVTILEY